MRNNSGFHRVPAHDRLRTKFCRGNTGRPLRNKLSILRQLRSDHRIARTSETSFYPRCARKGAAYRLTRARRLADQHDIAQDRLTRNRGRLHPQATPATQEMSDMVIKPSLNA